MRGRPLGSKNKATRALDRCVHNHDLTIPENVTTKTVCRICEREGLKRSRARQSSPAVVLDDQKETPQA